MRSQAIAYFGTFVYIGSARGVDRTQAFIFIFAFMTESYECAAPQCVSDA